MFMSLSQSGRLRSILPSDFLIQSILKFATPPSLSELAKPHKVWPGIFKCGARKEDRTNFYFLPSRFLDFLLLGLIGFFWCQDSCLGSESSAAVARRHAIQYLHHKNKQAENKNLISHKGQSNFSRLVNIAPHWESTICIYLRIHPDFA